MIRSYSIIIALCFASSLSLEAAKKIYITSSSLPNPEAPEAPPQLHARSKLTQSQKRLREYRKLMDRTGLGVARAIHKKHSLIIEGSDNFAKKIHTSSQGGLIKNANSYKALSNSEKESSRKTWDAEVLQPLKKSLKDLQNFSTKNKGLKKQLAQETNKIQKLIDKYNKEIIELTYGPDNWEEAEAYDSREGVKKLAAKRLF